MPKPKKKHHYISQFYLGGFTSSGEKADSLWVLDQNNVKQWKSKPSNIAYEFDFNKIDAPEINPNIIEDSLAKFEYKVAPVIKDIISKKCLPTGNDFILLMNMVALFSTNIPNQREIISRAIGDVAKAMLSLAIETPERWQSAIKNAKIDDIDNNSVDYEKMKSFFESNKYSIEASKYFHIMTFFDSIDTILPYLINRKWRLLLTDEDTGQFICSDNPIALVWTVKVPPFYQNSPGFGMNNTELTMPLSKNVALIAKFEEIDKNVMKADRNTVAIINSRTAMYSKRFIYSSKKDFIWLMEDKKIGNTNDLLGELNKNNHPLKTD